MNKTYKDSIQAAQKLLLQSKDAAHDYSHAERVAKDIKAICQAINFRAEEPLLEVCAWWHDVGRLYNPNHEKLSAKLLNKDLKHRGVTYKVRRRAFLSVYKHRLRMHPRTIEGRILRDADKLDEISIERWQKCEETGNHRHNERILKRNLPGLRNKFYFPKSKALYDARIDNFKDYLSGLGVKVDGF